MVKFDQEVTYMKCPNCGCEEFYSTNLKTDANACEGGSLDIMIDGELVMAHVCKKCGKVELFVKLQDKKPEKKSIHGIIY